MVKLQYKSLVIMIERIKNFINAGVGRSPKSESQWIVSQYKEILHKSPKSESCSYCVMECAIELYNHMSKKTKKQPTKGKYKLKEWVNVTFRGHLVNPATINDKLAEFILSNGFPKEYFYEIRDNEADKVAGDSTSLGDNQIGGQTEAI